MSAARLPAPFRAPCCHCGRWSSAAIACRHIERASGPGFTLYACPDCVVIVGVGAVADDVLTPPPALINFRSNKEN
ncbi:MAG TPA: hypothetical protein VIU15_00240 [Streptomyces sp.]